MIKLIDLINEEYRIVEKDVKLDKPNEFEGMGPRKVKYRGFIVKKQAYGWYVEGASNVPEINSGKYMGLSFALKDIDKAYKKGYKK